MKLFFYNAIVKSVYDGDTIRADIDLGFNIWMFNEQIRFLGINAPEIRGEQRPQGLLSRQFVLDRIPPGTEFKLLTERDRKGKYGRYLGTIFYGDALTNLNQELLEAGHAIPFG